MFIRKLKSRNGNMQVQVVEKINRNNKVIKHLGTARNTLEIKQLTTLAQQYIDNARIKQGRVSLFDNRYEESEVANFLSHLVVLGAYDSVTFHFFNYFYKLLGFSYLNDDCFADLVIARIAHPVSKEKTREWLEDKFGIIHRYSLTALYRAMERSFKCNYHQKIEERIWNFTTQSFPTDISVLFFDVTTLYYEAFDEDDFRKFGYSKDRKENQPQLVIALTVNTKGIPLHVKVFPGNKFEGHTMIPCIQDIVRKHKLKEFVVVADSAMVSTNNMDELERIELKFIVGARLANLPQKLFDQVVVTVPKTDGSLCRFAFAGGRILVVGYSTKRANKDRTDRNKQIKRAQYALFNPTVIAKRYKFLKKVGKDKWELNQANLEKAEKLEGLKGYVTNAQELTNEDIMLKYSALWNVEKSFRISKSDLKARPVFHTVKEKIEAHVTIVFAALAIARYVEITTGKSLERIVNLLEKTKEVILQDTLSQETFSKYTQADNPEVQKLLKLANITWVT
jgi:transposase